VENLLKESQREETRCSGVRRSRATEDATASSAAGAPVHADGSKVIEKPRIIPNGVNL
jgi:hypothetical protein